jgi:hypothetical protein
VRFDDLAHGVSGIFYVNAITDLYGRGCVFVYELHGISLVKYFVDDEDEQEGYEHDERKQECEREGIRHGISFERVVVEEVSTSG